MKRGSSKSRLKIKEEVLDEDNAEALEVDVGVHAECGPNCSLRVKCVVMMPNKTG